MTDSWGAYHQKGSFHLRMSCALIVCDDINCLALNTAFCSFIVNGRDYQRSENQINAQNGLAQSQSIHLSCSAMVCNIYHI